MSSKKPTVIKKAFTTTSPMIRNQLLNEANIWTNTASHKANALWDTGATNSCISTGVVQALSLIPTGQKDIRTPSGKDTVNTYLVNITLPNNVVIPDIEVCDSQIGNQGIDLLVGMDIITQGDLSVTNFSGQTVFSFCIPSTKRIDYVKEINLENIIGPKHGTGKKNKKKK